MTKAEMQARIDELEAEIARLKRPGRIVTRAEHGPEYVVPPDGRATGHTITVHTAPVVDEDRLRALIRKHIG